MPATTAAATLTAKYNDLESVKALVEANKGEISGVILEPVVGNAGFIPPTKEFLLGLQKLCKEVRAGLVHVRCWACCKRATARALRALWPSGRPTTNTTRARRLIVAAVLPLCRRASCCALTR